jgi:hypothetical protein
MKRYRLICVAPEVPDAGSYDDLDEAIVAAGSSPNWEIFDEEDNQWVPMPCCWEEVMEARSKLLIKQSIRRADLGGLGPLLMQRYHSGNESSNHLPTREDALAAIRYALHHLPCHEEHDVLCIDGPLCGEYVEWPTDALELHVGDGHYILRRDFRTAAWWEHNVAYAEHHYRLLERYGPSVQKRCLELLPWWARKTA